MAVPTLSASNVIGNIPSFQVGIAESWSVSPSKQSQVRSLMIRALDFYQKLWYDSYINEGRFIMDFEKLKGYAREDNLAILRKEINQKWVDNKIINYLSRHPYLKITIDEMKERILLDDFTGSVFLKEPSRQNFTERAATKFLEKITVLEHFTAHGSASKYFLYNGQIITQRQIGLKSVDFSWLVGDYECYATQKYTNEAGGAQDNQFNDVVAFLKEANNLPSNCYIFAIVDGSYYTPEKIKILKNIQHSDQVIVCSLEEVESYCLQILKKN